MVARQELLKCATPQQEEESKEKMSATKSSSTTPSFKKLFEQREQEQEQILLKKKAEKENIEKILKDELQKEKQKAETQIGKKGKINEKNIEKTKDMLNELKKKTKKQSKKFFDDLNLKVKIRKQRTGKEQKFYHSKDKVNPPLLKFLNRSLYDKSFRIGLDKYRAKRSVIGPALDFVTESK